MRSNFELQKLAEWWFDISKILSVIVLLAGIVAVISCANIGLEFARMVKG